MKKYSYLFFLLVFFLFLSSKVLAAEKLPVLIINQVRGNEACCLPGNGKLLELISSDETLKNTAISWAVRFDALTNDDEIKKYKGLPGKNTIGALLEITPALASASGVLYKGDLNGADWHYGKHVFLIGYSQDERKKLIDTYMSAFRYQFSGLPFFVVSWMIDSWSLNYLHDNYGVRVAEITKEQYTTDGYTLYGGVFNLPYFASRNHPLMPTDSDKGMLMVRQTISDSEKNYGSFQSYFTSQPNDYLSNPAKTTISYFESLLDSNQFALLGLENSEKLSAYHEEYLKQLQSVILRQTNGEVEVLSPADYYNLHNQDALKPGRVVKSNNFPNNGAFWYFGASYRARIENWDGKLVLTDYRIFSDSLLDPYFSQKAEFSQAYWIVPYLLDSSQQYKVNSKDLLYEGNPIRRDVAASRFGIQLSATLPTEITQNGEVVRFKVGDASILQLTPTSIELADAETDISFNDPIALNLAQLMEINTPQYVFFDRHPRFFLLPNRETKQLQMGWENASLSQIVFATLTYVDSGWKLEPRALVQSEIDSLSAIFQPDKSPLKMTPATSVFYWSNTEAIVNRNPIRLYVDPRNSLMRPVSLDSFSAEVSNPDFQIQEPHNLQTLLDPFFIDITSTTAGDGLVKLTVDGTILGDSTRVRFYTDCSQNIVYCATHTDELIGFGKILLKEKKTEFEHKFREVVRNIEMELRKRLKNLPKPDFKNN